MLNVLLLLIHQILQRILTLSHNLLNLLSEIYVVLPCLVTPNHHVFQRRRLILIISLFSEFTHATAWMEMAGEDLRVQGI